MRTGNESLVNILDERGLSIIYDHNSVFTLWEQIIVEVVPAYASH